MFFLFYGSFQASQMGFVLETIPSGDLRVFSAIDFPTEDRARSRMKQCKFSQRIVAECKG